METKLLKYFYKQKKIFLIFNLSWHTHMCSTGSITFIRSIYQRFLSVHLNPFKLKMWSLALVPLEGFIFSNFIYAKFFSFLTITLTQ